MNRDSIIDFLGFIIVKAVSVVFWMMPLRAALWIGRRIGDLALLFNVKRRSIAYANLKSAFPDKDYGEIKNILRAHYRNLGMSIVELLKVPVMGKGYLDRHVRIDNFERIERVIKEGRGVILLTAHFGNWEIPSLAVSSRGRGISVFAREQKYTRLNNLLNRYREMTGCRVIAKGFSARDIIKTLNEKGIVGMLADQDAGPNGVFVNFLNRPASAAQGPVSFGLKTGAAILPSFVRRVSRDKHMTEINEPLELTDTGDKEKDMKENLEKISRILESYIKRFPEQWLWSHKRWKSTPQRTVLVLNDGKAGHLNQGMAIAEMIEEALSSRLKDRGIEEKAIVKVYTAEVKFKNRFRRLLLDLASLFAGRRCQGCMRCLRFCLDKKTFDEIKNRYADIIISCGASTAAVNLYLKYENNAKNIIVMEPRPGLGSKTDLIILPRHDAPGRSKSNVLITELAPNRIIARTADGERRTANTGIGLLIGGNTKNFKLDKGSVEKVVDGVLKIAEERGQDIFITTSRRTSAEIDGFLKNRLGNNERCKLLVIANEKNPEGTVSRILGMSRIVIVSPESISMISEAVSSGIYVVVFRDAKIRKARKYEGAIINLELEGYIKIVDTHMIYETVKELLIKNPPLKEVEDRKRIAEALKKLI